MAPRSLYAIAVAMLALAACSDREPDSTTGPQFAPATTDVCGFSNSLISDYFPSSHQGKIVTLKQSMASAGHGTPDARTFGFEIMDSIGAVSRSFSVDPAVGAQLTVALIGCMFTQTFDYPTDAISDFTKALNKADGGAYYVRGGGSGGEDVAGRSEAVLGTSYLLLDTVNLSGIEPSSGSWTNMLKVVAGRPATNDLSEGRALIYGYLVPDPDRLLYDWATVPSALTFGPPAVVAVCDNDDGPAAMVQQLDIGVLAYAETGICDDTQSLTSVEAGWGPRALATRLSRMIVGAFAPEPLQATVLASRTGGTTTTVPKSKFGKRTVSSLTLVWKNQPPPTIKGTDNPLTTALENAFPVKFAVATEAGDPIAGTCAYLSGANNNGTATMLTKQEPRQHASCTAPPNGDASALSVLLTTETISGKTASVADFGQVGVTKTGGIIFTGIADVIGRAGLGSIQSKSNVKPAGK
jgi:hypothetical protein